MVRTVAIAGLGAAARQIHLPALARLPGAQVVGGCDPLARPAAFPFPVFATVEELLARSAPDILVVAAPTGHHAALARAGLEAGCHIFCEKPFADDLGEARALVSLAGARGRRIVVNNQYRFMRSHAAARARIGGPDFGALLFLDARQTIRADARTEAGWRGRDPRRTCKDFGTHVFDLCRFFFGADPRAVDARMPRGDNLGGPDFLNLIRLEFPGDRVAQITLDRLARGPQRYLELRLDGSRGAIETTLGGSAEVRLGLARRTRRPFAAVDIAPGGSARLYADGAGERGRRIATDPREPFVAATRRLLAAFLAALDSGGIPPCDGADNLRTLALMLAAYESAERGAPVAPCYDAPSQAGTGGAQP